MATMTEPVVTEISATDVTKKLTDVLNGTKFGNKRYLVRRHGKPAGAFVSIADLELLTGKTIDEITRETTSE